METNIRIFISYSHKDQDIVERLAEIIKRAGMLPLWTKKLAAGIVFDEQIKDFIQHAHIFMPVISESSSGWVHQEIGYALALHIPVFPVTFDNLNPAGMLQMIQTVKLSNDKTILSGQINKEIFTRLLAGNSQPAIYQRADFVEERAGMMKDYAEKLLQMDESGVVRQKGGLSSFHIPDDPINNQKWNDRYTPEKRSEYHKRAQREERIALQKHATKSGCRLIINPSYAIEGRSNLAAITRIKTLIEFLEYMPDEKVVIAIQTGKTNKESLTMVGDWFLSESVSFKNEDGFTNTFFTRNASEITRRIRDFEEELRYLLKENKWAESNSRGKAIEYLTDLASTIPSV
jgi:hypothetical protein